MNKQNNLDLRSPLLLVIEITDRCNLNCKYCYDRFGYNKRENCDISLEDFSLIVEEANEIGIFDINLSGGEPFIHKDILKFIEIIKSAKLGISIVSNGTFIGKEIAKSLFELEIIPFIQISFDGHTPDIHNKTRQLYNETYRGFMNLVEEAGNKELSPSIGIVINKYNFLDISEAIDFFSKFTSRFHLMNVMGHPEIELSAIERDIFSAEIIPQIKDIAISKSIAVSNFNDKNPTITNFQARDSHIDCLAGFTTLVLSPNKEVFPCDIARYSLSEWNGKGSLLKIFNNSKKLWRNMTKPWCLSDLCAYSSDCDEHLLF